MSQRAPAWTALRLKFAFDEIDQRLGSDRGDLPLLSVSIHKGVLPREELTDRQARADDFEAYKLVRAGDLVINRMRAFEGGAGISGKDGIVSSDYAVLRPRSILNPRYFHYLVRSRWFVSEMTARLRGIGNADLGNVRTPRINVKDLGEIRVQLPVWDAQVVIADELDAESDRVNRLVQTRRRQVDLIDERLDSQIWEAVTKGVRSATMRPSGLAWVGTMPAHWTLPPIGANFEVQLGKMLNPEATSAGVQHAYLRNVNVQWDRIDLSDLNTMHFDAADQARYGLKAGDLIVCEGGVVGRAAIWDGQIDDCYYQKALHRVRPRGQSRVRFLLYALWAASGRGVFEIEGNTSTIVHLTAEKLRAHRFPWPPLDEQDEITGQLDRARGDAALLKATWLREIDLLEERRDAVIDSLVREGRAPRGAAA